MADANAKKDFPPRTFVKEMPDGSKLTRTVTGPSTEVAAKFDGFVEQTGSTKTSGGSSGGGAAGAKPNSPS
jgi:hypothetical protein